MLRELRIQNFVLIENVKLSFEPGFTVITGETGSGKSILLNALNLLKGDRADFGVIGPKSQKSVVEGEFTMLDGQQQILENLDIEIWKELTIRREIHKDGKSRAFVNDTPVSLVQLKSISKDLLSIHSQYNTLDLRDKDYQFDVLDDLSKTKVESRVFKSNHSALKNSERTLSDLKLKLNTLIGRQDYETFILEELRQLNLDTLDYAGLELKLNQQENKEALLQLYSQIKELSEGQQGSVFQDIRYKVDKNLTLDPDLEEVQETMQSISELFKNLDYVANNKIDSWSTEDVEAGSLLEKVDDYNRLLNKHRCKNQNELMAVQAQLSGNESDIESLQLDIVQLENDIQNRLLELIGEAKTLNQARTASFPLIENEMLHGLGLLKLADATLKFELQETKELNEFGGVDIKMLFSANSNMVPVPIEKAASGGELSRVMLILQNMISSRRHLPSILFDEIDTGVSGDVAERMGLMLKEMGRNRQLIAITHLPQVAAQAAYHFKVQKQAGSEGVLTEVIPLGLEERVFEVARLMSGEVITQDAIRTARHLMSVA